MSEGFDEGDMNMIEKGGRGFWGAGGWIWCLLEGGWGGNASAEWGLGPHIVKRVDMNPGVR